MNQTRAVTKDTWIEILRHAYDLFDDLKSKGFGDPPFSLGGGTVLMLHYKHRLSKDIDLFGYDVQWLSLVSPRLNDRAGVIAKQYVEQANSVKIVTDVGDIDFVVAADVIRPTTRKKISLAGREIGIDPPSEILAKKLFYRAAMFQPRDVYDMSAAIDLDAVSARKAVEAAAPKKGVLVQRLESLRSRPEGDLLSGIVPYEGPLRHGAGMVEKVIAFVGGNGLPVRSRDRGAGRDEGGRG